DRLLRSVGRGAGQGPRAADHSRAREPDRAEALARQLDLRADPALSPPEGDDVVVNVEILADADTAARRAAGVIAYDAREAVAARNCFVMAVSGGKSPWIMLRALANEDVPWKKVHVFQVDERVAPAGDSVFNVTPTTE